MNIQDLGSIGELVAAIATLGTLMYLAIQIRQNTQSVKATAQESSTRAVWEFMELLAQDPDVARIYNEGIRDFRGLSQEDRFRFASLLGALLHRMENMVAQHRRGLLPKEAWEGASSRVRDTFQFPGTIQWWEGGKHAFNQEFQNWIDTEIVNLSPQDLDDA